MKKIALALILWLFATSVAIAQGIGATKDIAVPFGNGSTAFQLTGPLFTYPSLLITPAVGNTTEIRWVAGTSSSVVASSTSPIMPPGGLCYAEGSSNQYVSFYGVSSSATVHITQVTVCPPGIGFAAGSGGGSGGSSAAVGPVGQPVPGSADYTGMSSPAGTLLGASGSMWGTAPTGLNVLGINANVLASVLPSGAASAANQVATQSAPGTIQTTVDNIQGNPNGLPVPTSGFKPSQAYVSLSAGSTSARVALPVNPPSSTIVVENMGANAACILLGGSTVTATSSGPICTGSDFIPGNSSYSYAVGSNTYLAAIQTSTGATSLNISGGAGMFAGAGGGGGTSTGGGGGGAITSPIGPQPSATSVSTVPATDARYPIIGAPNITTTGTITLADTNQICSGTNWGNQTACVGTPTPGSAYQVAISSAGYIWVQANTTGGTPTVNFAIRISNDGGATWFNRGIFEVTNVAPFQLNNIVTPNFAGWLTGGVTNVEVIATAYSGAGSTTITITQGQATPFVTSSATSSSLNGTGSSAATNIQGNGTSALPINTDLQQMANTALGAPTAWGTAPIAGTIVPNVNANVLGSITVASSPLPIGAATAANQEVTAAGTSATSAQGVQGVTNGVPFGVQGVTGGAPVTVQGSASGTPVGVQGITNGAPVNVQGITSGTPLTVQGSASGTPMPVSGTVSCSNCTGGGSGGGGSGGSGGGTVQTTASVPIHITTATTAVLVPHTTGDYTYVTGWDIIAAGTGNWELVYGTQTTTPCDTGQHALTGNYNLTAQSGAVKNAAGTSLVVPLNQDVCAITSAAVSYDGSIQYTQSSIALTSFQGGGGSLSTQASASAPINISTTGLTQLVPASGTTAIYVTAWDAIANGTTTFTLDYGTGTNCATGTTALTGPYGFTAGNGIAKGSGLGPLLFVPAGAALCANNSAATQVSGSISYAQY